MIIQVTTGESPMPYEWSPVPRTKFTPRYVIRIVWKATMLSAATPNCPMILSNLPWTIAM